MCEFRKIIRFLKFCYNTWCGEKCEEIILPDCAAKIIQKMCSFCSKWRNILPKDFVLHVADALCIVFIQAVKNQECDSLKHRELEVVFCFSLIVWFFFNLSALSGEYHSTEIVDVGSRRFSWLHHLNASFSVKWFIGIRSTFKIGVLR